MKRRDIMRAWADYCSAVDSNAELRSAVE
jgi:hypothetical protein